MAWYCYEPETAEKTVFGATTIYAGSKSVFVGESVKV